MPAPKEIRLYAVLLSREEMERIVAALPDNEPISLTLKDLLEKTKPDSPSRSRP